MKHPKSIITTAVLLGSLLFSGTQAANAQGPMRGGMDGLMALSACSTTNYTEVAATALGITAPELRVALVSGKTLESLAKEKNVDYATVTKALEDARLAEIDQAVKDGLITQEQADMFKTGIMAAGQPIKIEPPKMGGRGDIEIRIGSMGAEMQVQRGNFEAVKPLSVAAQALGVSCADLVKELQGGKSMVLLAQEKNIQAQVLIDALMKAFEDALAQDVSEGLITEAQAQGKSTRLIERVTMMISQAGMMGIGVFGGPVMIEVGGNGGHPGQPGNKGWQPGNPGANVTPVAPNATATPGN